MENPTALIIGANSGIAKALARTLVERGDSLVVITRCSDYYRSKAFNNTRVVLVENYEEKAITKALEAINQITKIEIVQVFICNGLLHNARCQPEKRLEDFSVNSFNEVLNVNTTTPILWLKALVTELTFKHPCKIAVLSARVGSISDNKLGGWYSYRASKAALNMLLKTASIELARRAKNIKLISFHPGTTDTALSKPFQQNVPKGKLFSPDFVAQQLLHIVKESQLDGELLYVDWQGKQIDW